MFKKEKKSLEEKGETYLKVKANPNSGKTEVAGILDDDTIKINIKAVPEKGKANKELIKFLAKEFSISKDNVNIISGGFDRVKLIKLTKNS
ncbi:hypothetical protein C0584_00165 [Candidatus Parcubacteria bacterium]|nr:MAG: hypothetical protein C0584_00165 [Candidatus Parcubacteria bacterium]